MQSREVRQAYAESADLYIELFASGNHEHPDDLDLIRRRLASRPGLGVDLGCGTGHLTRLMGAPGSRVIGIDLVPEFLQHARSAHPGLEFQQGFLTNLPLRDGSVANALCWYSLIHFTPDAINEALVEVRRVMEPGGALVLGFFSGDTIEPFDHKVVTAYRWPMDEVAHRLNEAGFDEVERLQRGQRGDRRPHGAIAARAT